jgi:Zn-dependent M16 (insulinase) family peptidase
VGPHRVGWSDAAQEGHRLEFQEATDPTTPLEYKGIVYNEMKGVMSDTGALFNYGVSEALYPGTTYQHNSGGDPEAIPDLTYEQLVEFHRAHYHPSNAYFYTYGDLPLRPWLEAIERDALR